LSSPTPARLVAYETLRRVFEEDAWADRALRSAAERAGLEGRERAQAQSLAYGAVQRRGTTDHFTEALSGRRLRRIDPPLLAALRLGLYELLLAPGSADHAAVDQAVELAKGPSGRRRGSGMVNAVLRRAGRERDELLAGLGDADPPGAAVAHSVPVWLASLWWEELGGAGARSLLSAINEPPERAYRVNRLRAVPGEALAELDSAGVAARRPDPGLPPAPAESLVVEDGEWSVVGERVGEGVLVPQSRASALVVDLLAPRPGERVLDLCAGPGIKATQIAAGLGGGGEGLVCVERDPGRAGELRELLARCGAEGVEVIEADAVGPPPPGGFDAVLVDPPCTGLGTLASRPDARWRREPSDVGRMATQAEAILRRGIEALRPEGRLVYSTCTISRRENEEVVGAVAGAADLDDLGAELPALRSELEPRCLQTRVDRDRTDGFFIARLRR
jgi:16S rRNA (cytosine967-C5)-methyltransferase